MTLRGNPKALQAFIEKVRTAPKTVAEKVAIEAAPQLTALALETFEAQETPYGTPWKPGAHGQTVTLHQTGKLEDQIHYEAVGPKLRVKLGARYAKYQIGKRPIFPRRNDLPDDYVNVLEEVAQSVLQEELGGGNAP